MLALQFSKMEPIATRCDGRSHGSADGRTGGWVGAGWWVYLLGWGKLVNIIGGLGLGWVILSTCENESKISRTNGRTWPKEFEEGRKGGGRRARTRERAGGLGRTCRRPGEQAVEHA